MGKLFSKSKDKHKGIPINGSMAQFRDRTGHVSPIKDVKLLEAVSESVCIIWITERTKKKGSKTDIETSHGTGFRVGDKYIMTANHVIGKANKRCYADFNFIDEHETPKKFGLKRVVYRNEYLDVAVVELQFTNLEDLPKPFSHFCRPVYHGSFHLIGHSQGAPKAYNIVKKIVNHRQAVNKIKLSVLEIQSEDIAHSTFGLNNQPESLYLFHCKFETGASGSPGVVFRGGNAYVTTMLIGGYPGWYYSENVTDEIRNQWKEEDCYEQGVNMKSLFDAMQSENKMLCDQVMINFCYNLPNIERVSM